MEKYLNRFYEVIDKIGKHNFVLIIFIFVALLSTGLYQTFSLYTESEGLSILDNIKTYSFILKANNEENSVVIAPNSSKNIDVTVTNEGETDLKYGLYYNTTADASDINIGYLVNTAYLPSGVVPKSTSYIVTLKVDNLSDENVTINFGLKYGFEDGGDLGIEEGNYWFNEYEKIYIGGLLSEVPVGSYVAYTGNNGCDTTDVNGWTSCSGKNANYVDDTDMGYCHDSNYKFNVNGWRIGYVNGGSAHLVASGSTDCLSSVSYSTVKSSIMTTEDISTFDQVYYGSSYTYDSDSGNYIIQEYELYSWSELERFIGDYKYTCQSSFVSSNTCSTLYEIDESSTDSEVRYYTYTSSVNDITDHIENLNNIGLKYCNTTYSKDGICDNTTAWGINAVDFEKITDISLGSDSCYGISNSAECGYNNNLINNGSYYWFGTQLDYSNNTMFYWQPYNYVIDSNTLDNDYGVRPVLSLDSSIIVVGGTGVYGDPYIISNTVPEEPETPEGESYLNTASVGSYVSYTGNNGCDTTDVNGWTSCSGKNANYVDDTDMGYCNNVSNKFSVNGWRIAYVEDGSAHLVGAGATDCLCTNSDGTPSNSSCSSSAIQNNLYMHFNNMDNIALKYCNIAYSKGGVCDNTSTWSMNASDFEKITNNPLIGSCIASSTAECGLNNNLIDNSGFYWYATPGNGSSSGFPFGWQPINHAVYGIDSLYANGVRPVLSLDSSVRITGGTGTYADPYIISNE